MAKRKTPRLAYSEYVSPDADNSVELWQARLRLIDVAKRVCPEFLKRLSADVFPLYCHLAEEGKLAKDGYDFQKALWSDNPWCTPYDVLTEDGGLKLALCNWASEFNAVVPWMMVGALRTLQGWYVAPDWRESLEWKSFHGFSSTVAIGEPFEFRYQGWEVQLLTWSQYCESLRRRFEETLLEYEGKTRELAESLGLIRARRTYSPDNLEWFALSQFARMTSTKIAARCALDGKAVDESTVLKGIKTASRLVRWDQPQEPPHSRNRKTR